MSRTRNSAGRARASIDALHEIENSGLLDDDIARARGFTIDALSTFGDKLPEVAARAARVARAFQAGSCSLEDLEAVRVAIWSECERLQCDLPDARGYAYRAAIAAVAGPDDFAELWYFLEAFLETSVAAGADDVALGELLKKHYGRVT